MSVYAGDFVLVKGHGLWSDIIEYVEHSEYTHVLSFIDSESYIDPIWPVINRVYGPVPADSAHYYVSPDLTDDERYRIGTELLKFVGQHYSVSAFLWCGATILFPFLKRFGDPILVVGEVCSTALAHAYKKAGVYAKLKVGDTPTDDVTPVMLAEAWIGG